MQPYSDGDENSVSTVETGNVCRHQRGGYPTPDVDLGKLHPIGEGGNNPTPENPDTESEGETNINAEPYCSYGTAKAGIFCGHRGSQTIPDR